MEVYFGMKNGTLKIELIRLMVYMLRLMAQLIKEGKNYKKNL